MSTDWNDDSEQRTPAPDAQGPPADDPGLAAGAGRKSLPPGDHTPALPRESRPLSREASAASPSLAPAAEGLREADLRALASDLRALHSAALRLGGDLRTTSSFLESCRAALDRQVGLLEGVAKDLEAVRKSPQATAYREALEVVRSFCAAAQPALSAGYEPAVRAAAEALQSSCQALLQEACLRVEQAAVEAFTGVDDALKAHRDELVQGLRSELDRRLPAPPPPPAHEAEEDGPARLQAARSHYSSLAREYAAAPLLWPPLEDWAAELLAADHWLPSTTEGLLQAEARDLASLSRALYGPRSFFALVAAPPQVEAPDGRAPEAASELRVRCAWPFLEELHRFAAYLHRRLWALGCSPILPIPGVTTFDARLHREEASARRTASRKQHGLVHQVFQAGLRCGGRVLLPATLGIYVSSETRGEASALSTARTAPPPPPPSTPGSPSLPRDEGVPGPDDLVRRPPAPQAEGL